MFAVKNEILHNEYIGPLQYDSSNPVYNFNHSFAPGQSAGQSAELKTY